MKMQKNVVFCKIFQFFNLLALFTLSTTCEFTKVKHLSDGGLNDISSDCNYCNFSVAIAT